MSDSPKPGSPPVIIAALRDAAWFNRRRLDAYARILFVIELAVFIFFVLGTHGMIIPLDKPTSTDFVSFYAAGLLTAQGHAADVYIRARHAAAEELALGVRGAGYNYFFYPPTFLLICQFLPRLPYLLSFVVWESLTGAAYLWVMRSILPPGRPLLPFLAFPAVLWNIGFGQNALLSASLLGGGTLLLERRPWLAGVLFGAMCYKPHLGLLIPVALAAGRHGRAFAAAALTAACLVGLTLLLYGPETWHNFLTLSASGTGGTFATAQIPYSGMISPYAALRKLGAANGPALAGQAVVVLAMVVAVIIVWRSNAAMPAKAMVLIAGTLLSPPVMLIYDLSLATLVMAWAWRDAASGGQGKGYLPWEKAGYAFVFLIAMVSRSFAFSGPVLLGPLAGVVLLMLGLARARRTT